MNFKEKLNKFFRYSGVKLTICQDEGQDDQEVYNLDSRYLIGTELDPKEVYCQKWHTKEQREKDGTCTLCIHKPKEKYFLQKIVEIPETRDTPADEDYVTLVENVDFSDVMRALMTAEANRALDQMGDDEQSDAADDFEKMVKGSDDDGSCGGLMV